MEKRRVEVLGLSGSLRKQSANTRVLAAIEHRMPDGVKLRRFEGIADLPQFNPDLDAADGESITAVSQWRAQLRTVDAIIICTPEYARGVPGSLKNALDWVVSSAELMNKPVAAISVSPHPEGGATALASLILTLKMMGAAIPEEAALAIPYVHAKFGPDGEVADPAIAASLRGLIQALLQAVE